MSNKNRQVEDRQKFETAEAGLADVLKHFRQSVHAWSDTEFARPRTVSPAVHHWTWQRATGWALGCVLAVSSLSAGILVHHRQEVREQRAHLAALRQSQQRQLAIEHTATQAQAPAAARDNDATASEDDAKLMAAVDKDVSREVPAAMEPLAQLMDDGANQ